MKIIVAADKNWGIGKDNKLLVSIPADMKMFRQETTGKVCVMGRKTLESFPGGLPLKNRTNIVLTRQSELQGKRCHHCSFHRGTVGRIEKISVQKMYTASAVTPSTNSFFHIATWHR